MRLRAYNIISEAICKGIEYGVRRAHKHDDNPAIDTIVEEAHHNAMIHLCEVLEFDACANGDCRVQCDP